MEKVFVPTKEELFDIVKQAVNESLANNHPQIIRGIQGLADFLGVSHPTAIRLKNSGLFPYIQHQRVLIFKADEVLNGLAQNGKNNTSTKDEQVDNKDPCVAEIDPDSLMEYVYQKSQQTIGTLKYQGLFNKEHLAMLCRKAFLFGIAVSSNTSNELKKYNGDLYPFNDYIK